MILRFSDVKNGPKTHVQREQAVCETLHETKALQSTSIVLFVSMWLDEHIVSDKLPWTQTTQFNIWPNPASPTGILNVYHNLESWMDSEAWLLSSLSEVGIADVTYETVWE